ncbi:MAG TPA: hypothetical protein VFX84_03540 [Candidatus Saccharimonadales bacterium]|nr:hypothetical protein [Candidatus Saccharimonadales bacterium]
MANLSGWVSFAGILLILRGIAEAFVGITALVNNQYLLISEGNQELITTVGNTTPWGLVHLAVGVVVLATGFSLLHGSNWARLFAIIFTGAAFLVSLAFLAVFPLWAIIALIVDGFILYGLVAGK